MRTVFSVLLALSMGLSGPSAALGPLADAEDLFLQRGRPEKLQAAIRLWEEAAKAEATAFEAAHRLAHAFYFLGIHQATRSQRLATLQRGIAQAQKAVALRPERVEGHFWLGVLDGVYAREKGIFKSLSMIKPIRESFKRALKADPAYHGGAPDRALGRFYYELPVLLGGSKKTSLRHLKKALGYQADNTLTLLYLADTLAAMGKKEEARKTYQAVLDAPIHPDWEAEDQENKALAEKALRRI